MSNSEFTIISDTGAIEELGRRLGASERFAMDLEFMSADRYIPDLSLVQLAWEEQGEIQTALVEGVGTDLSAIFSQVESQDVLTLAHGAKQDLSLLGTRYQVVAGAFMDTQIAAAFAGVSEQIGYGNLVERLVGKKLDKGPQFTDWHRRPLSPKQLRYAVDDVLYLLPVWDELRRRLDKVERREWARHESALMASAAATRRPADQAYLHVGGAGALKGGALGALRALATWREETAVANNIPPSWIIPDSAAVEVCRRKIRTERDFKKVRGVGSGIVNKYGAAILREVEKGAQESVPRSGSRHALEPAWQAQAQVLTSLVAGRAAAVGLPQRTLAAKADAEALVRHHLGQVEAKECKLLQGWRAEILGDAALAWLRGDGAVVADDKVGVRLEQANKA